MLNLESRRRTARRYLTRRRPSPVAIICCALCVIFFIAMTIVLSLIPTYLPSRNLGTINSNSLGVPFNVTYGTNLTNISSLIITDFAALSTSFMEGLNLEGITILSAQLVPPPLTSAGRKRRATDTTNTECGTDSCTTGDLLNIAFFINYPLRCLASAMCKKMFIETVEFTIAMQRCKLILTIPIISDSILNVPLTFCPFDQFDSVPIHTTTTATTVPISAPTIEMSTGTATTTKSC